MYLFHRSARLRGGDLRKQLAWATAITEKVNQISETPVSLWTTFCSPASGTLAWTTFVDSLASLEATTDKLAADNGYLDLVEQGATWDSGQGVEDGLMQYLIEPEKADHAPAYTTVVRATLAAGQYVRGIEVGLEIAGKARQATASHTSFATSLSGAYGGVAWLTGFDTIEELETSQHKLAADPNFASYVDTEAAEAYLPGATVQTIYRRIV